MGRIESYLLKRQAQLSADINKLSLEIEKGTEAKENIETLQGLWKLFDDKQHRLMEVEDILEELPNLVGRKAKSIVVELQLSYLLECGQ